MLKGFKVLRINFLPNPIVLTNSDKYPTNEFQIMNHKSEIKELYLAKKTAQFVLPLLEKYYRAEYKGLENIPKRLLKTKSGND